MEFPLSSPIPLPVELLSPSELFTLRYVVPGLLVLPWFLYLLYQVLRWLSRFFRSRDTHGDFHPDLSWLKDSPPPRERALSLTEIERLAVDDPRRAIRELSRYFRVNHLKSKYRSYSLEYFVKDQEVTIFSLGRKWLNLFRDKEKKNLTHRFSPLFVDMVEAAYGSEELTTQIVLEFLERMKSGDWGNSSDGN